MRCYDMSQLNLLHGTNNYKWRTEKLKNNMLRRIGKQFGESVESVWKKKRKVTVERICRKKGFKPGMKQ